MDRSDNRILRVGVVFGAVALALVALRGRLPESDTSASARRPADGAATMITLVALGLVAAAILALTLVEAYRAQRVKPQIPMQPRARSPRPRLRHVLAAVLIIVAVLAAMGVLLAIRVPIGPDDAQPTPSQPSSGPGTDQPRPPPAADGQISDVPTAPIVAVAVLLVALAVGGTILLAARSPSGAMAGEASFDPDEGPSPTTDDPPAALVRAATLSLAEVTQPGRDPRAAIIACYAVMERELADAPGVAPQPSDTPSEVLDRAVARGALHRETAAAAPLVGLFAEARFSPHEMTERHRESAVTWLRMLLDDLGGRP
ncbi:hypothetical protein GOARA_064_02020 [Gordonia araii NBRC 100433]|uniref:Protein-glutamine gamma-glutamyltransferase-like C-terminal domain-containing protein n=1 Tax=Gordonia araii NBRC 100433 TaxID=1073574 RepID=G7H5S5_9ACTN|nr:DUF4129 domain-containing protein [Gordonia araii]NNG95910.1 DUF4129 domain-containing protein [Gordonia araii NBRC 100433]GAB11200.1 hypothetical protein GOARA_064_02020 [Gordonia araii NBRC 100433]